MKLKQGHPIFLFILAALSLVFSAAGGVVISGGGLALLQEGGTFATNDLATNGTAFAPDVIGVAPHAIVKVNDGLYGNSNSWIGGASSSFIGVSFGVTSRAIGRVAFGRDNTGIYADRSLGTYTLQFTTVANPTQATPDTNWTTIGTLQYVSAGGANFSTPPFRHLFSFNAVVATGFRIKTDSLAGGANTICLDEIELYAPPAPSVTVLAAVPGTNSVILTGTVNPNQLPTAAYFQYGLTTNYGSFSPTNFLAATNVNLSVSNFISGLPFATTYHFRLVAESMSGIGVSGDLTFTTSPIAPGVTTVAASNVFPTNAVLNGTVIPNGAATMAYFRYGLTTNYDSLTATSSVGAGTNAVSVTNLVSALTPGTLYHCQLAASNSAGLSLGNDITFNTLALPPAVSTLPASLVTATNAVLNGTVNPGGDVTSAYFQYGQSTNYGAFSATNTLAATNAALSAAISLNGLLPSTTYHFRFVAVNSAGTGLGSDFIFTTPRLPTNTAVTSLADSGAGSLRAAILDSIPGDTITFVTNGTITLTAGELFVANSVTINGPGATNLIINGNHASRVFNLAAGTSNNFSGFSIVNGLAPSGANAVVPGSSFPGGPGSPGGGIYNAGILTLIGCRLTGNAAGDGGWGADSTFDGIFFHGAGNGGNGGSGSGIYNSGAATLLNCTLNNNGGGSGGLPGSGGVSGGNAGHGGGIYNSGTLNMIQCTLAGNFTTSGNLMGSGGAVYNTGSLTVTSCTLYGNVLNVGPSASGGAIWGDCTLRNTLVALNTAPEISGNVTSQGHNLIGVPNGSSVLPLGNYGGPFPTVALTVGSLAQDTGDDSLLGAPFNLTTDQRGYPRKVRGHVDIGAFELLSYDTNYDGMVSSTELNAALSLAFSAVNTVLTNYSDDAADPAVVATLLGQLQGNWTVNQSNLEALLNHYNHGVTDTNALASVLARLNGNGIVGPSDLQFVQANYYAHSPFLSMTNTAGLGGTNVSFALSDPSVGAYNVQYSTNLTDWQTLGLATPRYLFIDTNAPAVPQRFYRLSAP